MKSWLILFIFVFVGTTMAQTRGQGRGRSNRIPTPQQESNGVKVQVLKLADKVAKLTVKSIHQLNRREMIALKQILQEAKAILKDTSIDDVYYPSVVCAQDDIITYQRTFADIKHMSKTTLGMFTHQAIDNATKWTQKYPCDYAEEFENKIQALISFSKNKLGSFTYQALDFANKNVDKLCLDFDYEQVFNAHFSFAKQQLGYFNHQAIDYAWVRVKEPMLSCDFQI